MGAPGRHPSSPVSPGLAHHLLSLRAGAALTLDEFALWLNLEDDYWTAKGRESIDAVVIFGSLLSLSALGGGVLPRFVRRVGQTPHSRESAKLLDSARHLRKRVKAKLADTL